ncbi:MAG: hypothetical protein CVT83_00910 [Alphaproteobacteria bacterium HGW-Alphaproteobacteria-5]|nr:MAG: hypothetical protein CVT83_00910 [Alphaproteobacteria bacterium HGW-Alphaproteobacteria-5]
MDRPLAQPGLYAMKMDGHPVLLGQICAACGHVSFPRQDFGCEKCGAYGEMLQKKELEAEGILRSFAEVHLHSGKGIEAPFTIGEVALADGPLVRATMLLHEGEAPVIGRPVSGKLCPQQDAQGEEELELRFEMKGERA